MEDYPKRKMDGLAFISDQINDFTSAIHSVEKPEVVILKTSILVERRLMEFIEGKVQRPERLDGIRIGVRDMIKLSRALLSVEIKGNEWIWTAVEKLSETRNKIAHHSDAETFNVKTKDLINYVNQQGRITGIFEDDDILRACYQIVVCLSYVLAHSLHSDCSRD